LQYISEFEEHFTLKTRKVTKQCEQYICGLTQARKKNMERMAEVVPGSNDQALQHFLSNSNWSARSVLNQVAMTADALLGGSKDSALLIDESCFAKKGEKSVGVNRQWNGNRGKTDNCQVAVFGALSQGASATLIDTRLYLPKKWIKDKPRCKDAGVPRKNQVMKSKSDLALEIVRDNRKLGVRFNWVGMDGGYGKDPALLRALEDDGEIFVADVHKDQLIYLEDPRPAIPQETTGRGRKRTRLIAQSEPIRVDQWVMEQPDSAWIRVILRESTKGKLYVETLHRRVWLWDRKEEKPRHWHLIVRREVKARNEIKYSLSNAASDTPMQQLAEMQGQRFWIERAFENGKEPAGLSHYQARGWKAWHHHMALVMMAMLFMLRERIEHRVSYPLLSCADIETLLAHFLPRRDTTVTEVMRQMAIRHKKRQASIDAACRKQNKEQSDALASSM